MGDLKYTNGFPDKKDKRALAAFVDALFDGESETETIADLWKSFCVVFGWETMANIQKFITELEINEPVEPADVIEKMTERFSPNSVHTALIAAGWIPPNENPIVARFGNGPLTGVSAQMTANWLKQIVPAGTIVSVVVGGDSESHEWFVGRDDDFVIDGDD